MVLSHKALICFWKRSKVTRVNNLFLSVRIKLFSTELQVAPRPKIRTFLEKKQQERANEKPTSNHGLEPVAWVMLIMPVTAFGFGVWQIMRKIEKTEMIRVLQEKSKIPPVELPKDLNQLKDMEFRAVRVRGKFDHSKEIHMGPRPFHTETPKDGSSLMSISKGGYLVITPFRLSDRNLTIHVCRGWVPGDKKSPKKRQEGQITEEVELVGLVRLPEKRQPFSLKNSPDKGIWLYRDLDEMSKVTNAAPILIDAVKSSSVPGGPIGGQAIVTLKDDHLTYMFTWFGMSVVTGWMWYNRYIRRATVSRGWIF